MGTLRPRACREQATIHCYRDLPRKAPRGLKHVWKAYKATVKLVGIQKSARPYPDNSFWSKLDVCKITDADNRVLGASAQGI
jgi:hypothetical protein